MLRGPSSRSDREGRASGKRRVRPEERLCWADARNPTRAWVSLTTMVRVRGLVCTALAALAAALGVTGAAAAAGPPDGRVYEQVSAEKKNGNEAGVTLGATPAGIVTVGSYGFAAPGGGAVTYYQEGPFGETSSGADLFSVSRRDPQAGWETSSVVPPEVVGNGDFLGQKPLTLLPSADLSRFLFVAIGPFVKENSVSTGALGANENEGLYRTRNNYEEPEWLTRPGFEDFSLAKPEPGKIRFGTEGVYPAGGSPDLSTVYFTYFGTLVPADAPRAPFVEPLSWSPTVTYSEGSIVEEGGKRYVSIKEPENEGHKPSATLGVWWEETAASGEGIFGPWGFYEWHAGGAHGELRSAGELPDHTFSPYGAVPAVTQKRTGGALKFPSARFLLNQVSQDGSRAFFISPEPFLAGQAGSPTELYVREQTPTGPMSVLVSRDELQAGSPKPPAPAAGCVKTESFSPSCAETAVTPFSAQKVRDAYVYASPDGSRAFFESKDKLAESADGKMPEGSGPWTYEFNLSIDKLTYLPGVVGSIAASSQDGSSFIFKNTETHKVELWSGGSAGHTEEIASFSTPAEPEFEAAASQNGTVFAFNTNAVLTHAPAFNNSSGVLQAYRYDVSSKQLSCVSCAPPGVPQLAIEAANGQRGQGREIADEGRRVFFGTATQLVPAAENGVEYVYEWEQKGTGSCSSEEQEGGCVYLVSSGGSHDRSFYLDNDESGEDVFFATRAGLAKNDTDESWDVYDARVGGGFPEPTPPAECGGTCRVAAAGPSLSGPISTAIGPAENTTRTTVESSGATTPKSGSKPPAKPLTRAQKLAKALRACAKKPKRLRAACIRRAKKLYGAKAKKTHAGSKRRRR
jgi:hypothetical protein